MLRKLGYNPSTVGYELKRETPEHPSRGRRLDYSSKRGAIHLSSKQEPLQTSQNGTVRLRVHSMMVEMVSLHKWFFDTCVGRARRMKLFPECEISCTNKDSVSPTLEWRISLGLVWTFCEWNSIPLLFFRLKIREMPCLRQVSTSVGFRQEHICSLGIRYCSWSKTQGWARNVYDCETADRRLSLTQNRW